MKKYIKSAIQSISDLQTQDLVELAMTTDSVEVMQEILDNGCSWVVKLAIADNRNVTTEILSRLAGDDNGTVREAAKWNLGDR